ncbi:urease accessory protein UreF [Lapillicoccus jejuensis]|uniref:Urease accessory protein n=1 Tax=Lapillicoccus jejuensis TaxID=402171 RepID=A0A542E547_9MICO|nr:urease accessory UreF family protein [Lapillicoccus jejuensis]TQJ10399.1 urease accessory protein [Lapillicoccus jejuensis]
MVETTRTAAVSPDLLLMLLADARLPTSGHTQSGGLEPALLGGLPEDGVVDYARTRLATVVRVDAGTAVVARGLALAGRRTDAVEVAWAARTPSPALRDASRDLGRALRRLALRVWPDAPALAELRLVRTPCRPRVVGLLGASLGLSPEQMARLVAYDDAQSVLAASLKLVPGDPAEATAALVALARDVEAVVTAVADLTDPSDVPATSAPLTEAWAQAHATAPRRLFRA